MSYENRNYKNPRGSLCRAFRTTFQYHKRHIGLHYSDDYFLSGKKPKRTLSKNRAILFIENLCDGWEYNVDYKKRKWSIYWKVKHEPSVQ